MSNEMVVTLRYYAGAAAAAGLDEELVTLPSGSTVADALAGARDRRGPALARVLAASSVLLDGVHQHSGDAPLAAGMTLDVLPPFAGG